MNKDFEPLLELQRKTKAGEVAPLVDVAIKHFWVWPGKAYWAYVRRSKIAIAQLELRKEKGLEGDARVANVVAAIGMQSWMTCGELFPHLMAEDSWQMVLALMEEDSADDWGMFHFGEAVDQQYGKLTPEEMDLIVSCKTVGEMAAMLEAIAAEGREKVMPRKRSLGQGLGSWLLVLFCVLGLLWLIVKFVCWLVARILSN